MILGYNREARAAGLPGKIKAGTKIHSIRLDPGKRWKPGMSIQHAIYGAKMKYHCFQEDVVDSVQEVRIVCMGQAIVDFTLVYVDNVPMINSEMEDLAQNDGFEPFNYLLKFLKIKPNEELKCRIIHWTEMRY